METKVNVTPLTNIIIDHVFIDNLDLTNQKNSDIPISDTIYTFILGEGILEDVI